MTELERRVTPARSVGRRARSRAAEARKQLDEQSADLAQREEIVDRRKREFDAYVRRVQGSFYSDR